MTFIKPVRVLRALFNYHVFRKVDIDYQGIVFPFRRKTHPWPLLRELIFERYEAPEIEAAQGIVEAGDIILELGTGMGIVSSIIAKTTKAKAIHSFEANPALIDTIRKVHDRNGISNIEVTNAVFLPDPKDKTMPFHVHESYADSSLAGGAKTVDTVDVPVLDLNEVIRQTSANVLVCDIEGAEQQVFDGVALENLRSIVVELHPDILPPVEIHKIFKTCIDAGLYPDIKLSSGQVVCFRRLWC